MIQKLELAPYPPAPVRAQLPESQWTQILDAWLKGIQYLLMLRPQELSSALEDPSVVQFIVTFVNNSDLKTSTKSRISKDAELQRYHFLFLHHLFCHKSLIPPTLLEPDFLAQASALYGRHRRFRDDLQSIWEVSSLDQSQSFIRFKAILVSSLEKGPHSTHAETIVQKALHLVKSSPGFAKTLMIGSDFVDAVADAYSRMGHQDNQKPLVLLVYHSFNSLMSVPNFDSTILDHLYSLQRTSLMRDVIRRTPFYQNFDNLVSHRGSGGARAAALLKTYASSNPPSFSKRKRDKDKAVSTTSTPGADDVHVHKMSLISQIQDLFPELGSAFIVKLLDEYGHDTELVTAHLLDNDLPTHLQTADKSAIVEPPTSTSRSRPEHVMQTPSSPSLPSIPERRNVYDNDDFDRLVIDTTKLHIGRKNADATADKLLSAEKPSTHKAAILSALAAFDSDDDERDDTYDSTDVGGTVDTSMGNLEANATRDENDQILLAEYKRDPKVFGRDAETRRSKARAALQERTQMTDEAIEGWLIMMERNPSRLQDLERKSTLVEGLHQQALASSAWKAQASTDTAENSDHEGTPTVQQGHGEGSSRGGRGRGRGRPNAGQGQASPLARQQKDANKASRANHNRRNQRAKKMARGGVLVG